MFLGLTNSCAWNAITPVSILLLRLIGILALIAFVGDIAIYGAIFMMIVIAAIINYNESQAK